MATINEAERNEIAYALMVLLASKKKPNIDFLGIFLEGLGRNPEEAKQMRIDFLAKYPAINLKMFANRVFEDGFKLNIVTFNKDFDVATASLKDEEQAPKE